MKLTIDFETRSPVDLKACGMYVYAQHPDTDVICLSVLEHGQKRPFIWFPEWVYILFDVDRQDHVLTDDGLATLLNTADTIAAHNAPFERCIHRWVMGRYGFEDIPTKKWRDTAAKAAAHALPRSLGQVCKVLGLDQQKDDRGHKVMLKMCKPRKPRKAEREADLDWEDNYYWHEGQEDFEILVEYCRQDTLAEYALDKALPDLKPFEQELWFYDQKINDRGIYADTGMIASIMDKLGTYEAELLHEISQLTYGDVTSVRQVAKTLEWMQVRGLELPDLQKGTVALALERKNLDPKVRRLLEIRQALGKSSVSKYTRMTEMTANDSRIHGTMLYHGASTGRWAGRGIQPQNMPRGTLNDWVEEALDEFATGTLAGIHTLFGCPMEAGSSCLRAVLGAEPGNILYCSDFSNIEGRVLAWLASEDWKLEAFRAFDRGSGPDLYKVAAAGIYGVGVDEVTKDQRQVGKVAELALGYAGGVRAFQAMASGYGLKISDEEAEATKNAWREKNSRIKDLWYKLEDATVNAVYTGRVVDLGFVKFGTTGRFLYAKLPSGRYLAYCDPDIRQVTTPWGAEKDALTFMGMNSMTNQWTRQTLYGGLWAENLTQAIARDFLAEGIRRLEIHGYPVVLHVHDEVVSEMPEGSGSLNEFNDILAIVPAWAEGCPISVEGWEGKRYKK